MIYKTVYGEFNGLYIRSEEGFFWLTQKLAHEGKGYVLLKKTDKGDYEAIRVIKD